MNEEIATDIVEFANEINLQLDAVIVNSKQREAMGKIIDNLILKYFGIDYNYNEKE